MSRIIVKNLPNKVKEKELVEHFSKYGLVTDVNLKYKKDGKFRGFAFIGFESNEVAEKSFQHFKDTYFKQNKITLDICQELDYKMKKSLAQQNLNNKLKNEAHIKKFSAAMKGENEMTKEKLLELMKNPDFIQYLKMNQKSMPGLMDFLQKTCDSDDQMKDVNTEEIGREEEEEKETKLANQEISDFEYLQRLIKSSATEPSEDEEETSEKKNWENLHTIVIRTKEKLETKEKRGRTITRKGVKEFLAPLKYRSLRIPRKMTFVAYVGFKTEKEMNQALLKDKSFLDGVRVRIHKYEQGNSKEANKIEENAPWKLAEDKLVQMAAPIAESGKLFVRNLWYSTTEEDLRELFEKIGPLADVTLPVSKLTRKSKGFANVTFVFPEHAVKAQNDLDGTSFKGRVLHILPSLDQEEEGSGPKSFKERKKEEQKKSASSWHNWNSLFLGSGAVIDLMAENFGASKHELFQEKEGQSVAVNLALGETQIVEETKRFLEEEGVSLEAFSSPNTQRSSTVLLAKNLPAKTSAQELRELFGRYGELGRVLLPVSGVTAIIEYLDPGEAKRGYQELAYSKFKYLPLYLEWAPILVFKTPSTKRKSDPDVPRNEENEEETQKLVVPESNTTLYIKNLNFKTEEDAITQHFSKIGEVHSVLISKRRAVSQGYGFVQFARAADAKKALKDLQNYTLDGHNLLLKYSEKKIASSPQGNRKLQIPGEPTSAKILVKNIPFQATVAEVRQLFKTFGELKFVRLPNKPASSEHRGFGFVEFITTEEAKKAFNSLGSSTHLYGRRLVLEWANEEETVEEMRRKTAQHFLGSESSNKRRKVEMPSTTEFEEN